MPNCEVPFVSAPVNERVLTHTQISVKTRLFSLEKKFCALDSSKVERVHGHSIESGSIEQHGIMKLD